MIERRTILRMGAMGALVTALAACGGTFGTSYASPVPAEVARGWRVAAINVVIPPSLVVSEAKVLNPRADIVWREDEGTDRRAQVTRIIADAARAGTAGLRGGRPVRLNITLARFHALTFEAERTLTRSGVHDVEFTLEVVDAASGARLAGPDYVEASLPAVVGTDMIEARSRGDSQKRQISAHLTKVFAGWFGLGPDPRQTFTRLGA